MSEPLAVIVAVHYAPEISGGVPRILIAEDFLRRAGFRVLIVTPQPIARGCRGGEILRVPAWRFPRPAAAPGSAAETDAIQRLPTALKQWVKGAAFFPDAFCWWARCAGRKAVRRLRSAPPDLVLTSSPQESSHAIGLRLKQEFGCRWVADFRDGWTFEPHRADAGWPLRRTLERRAERKIVEAADFVTAATRPIAEDFQARFPSLAGRVHFLPTGFAEFLPPGESRDPEVFRMVYTGRFSLSHLSRGSAFFLKGCGGRWPPTRPFAQIPPRRGRRSFAAGTRRAEVLACGRPHRRGRRAAL